MGKNAHDASRRTLLRWRSNASEHRLPWLVADRLVDECTRCGECLATCPEQIITRSSGGFPSVDFARGECTFCGTCADSCPESLFDRSCESPWQLKASIADECLARHRTMCRSCEDACAPAAIEFKAALGRPPIPEIIHDDCTGCGACVSICPQGAISIR